MKPLLRDRNKYCGWEYWGKCLVPPLAKAKGLKSQAK
jgi:hypothetical protein